MKSLLFRSLAGSIIGAWLTFSQSCSLFAAEPGLLWQIGAPDNNNAEFNLAPGSYNQFKNDGLFIVGESDAKRDWPYVQPGPQDAWAGGRQHTFLVLFGLKSAPSTGECRLEINLIDTQQGNPPKLRIQINGYSCEQSLPSGGGDASIFGQPAKGKSYKFSIPFPSSQLSAGDNVISITTQSGSWMLYDWLGLTTPAGAEIAKVQSGTVIENVEPVRAALEKNGKRVQPVMVTLRQFGGQADGMARAEGGDPTAFHLKTGSQTVEVFVPAVSKEEQCHLVVEVAGKALRPLSFNLKPVKKITVYILPHSHTDIGYTEIQTAIEKKQVNNLVEGIAAARRTASYPEGARFVWNVEVGWAADLYLHRLNEQQRADFFEAVTKGQVVLNGMYLNELSGLCRPEELIRLFRYSTQLGDQCGVKVDSAMISDVPGHTWGIVPAMAQAGIKYFSTAPNYFDRIGTILREWENKPFYWVGPDGQSKVLVWIPFWGYAMSHRYGVFSPQLVDDLCDGLEKKNYPYDIAYTRWSGHGDNAVPDPAICEFVKEWNAKYSSPHFIISGTGEAFSAFEKRYGKELPVVRGDWTPYWEDGAASSALETSLNRASSDRVAQAETLFAMNKPASYPAAAFEDAWRDTLLYSEHTWGADCSIGQPESQRTREQWDIKQSYALRADKQSRDLLNQSLSGTAAAEASAVDVYNTLCWARTELTVLSRELSSGGDRVTDESGKPVPSQRLASGELVFLAKDMPPMAAKRFKVAAGVPHAEGRATAQGAVLDNGLIRVRLDEKTGGIAELSAKGIDANFADTSGGETLNDYLYLVGDDVASIKRNGPVTIRVGEPGPLVASLVIESAAPGCKNLRREIRLVAGMDHVELMNLVDKSQIKAKNYYDKDGKESVNFAFPFNVPGGEMLLDIPLGVMRPEDDQMPSACKNWFSVGRWADISNRERGITWVTLDAPLVQVGGITATLLNSQTNPDVWRKKVERSQKLYTWAMNNHWGTNYRAYQEGPTIFRFILRPHRGTTPDAATRFATAFSQPLQPAPARGSAPQGKPLLRVQPESVIVTGVKPSDDGKALIVRLFGASNKEAKANLEWSKPQKTWLSDTSEKPLRQLDGSVAIPAWGVVTLRVSPE